MPVPAYSLDSPGDLAVRAVNAAFAAVVRTWYRCDTSGGSFNATMPIVTAESDGNNVVFENLAGTNNLNVVTNGTDGATIEGVSSLALGPGDWVELTYRASNGQWYMRRYTSLPTPGTNARRDANGNLGVATPVAGAAGAAHATPRSYVDSRTPAPQPVFTFMGSLSLSVGQAPRIYNDTGRTLTIASVRAAVVTAPTGAAIIVDVNKNGTSIFTTQANRPTIAVSTNTVKATNMDVTTLADGDYLTFDIDQIGSTVPGSSLSVSVVLVG